MNIGKKHKNKIFWNKIKLTLNYMEIDYGMNVSENITIMKNFKINMIQGLAHNLVLFFIY